MRLSFFAFQNFRVSRFHCVSLETLFAHIKTFTRFHASIYSPNPLSKKLRSLLGHVSPFSSFFFSLSHIFGSASPYTPKLFASLDSDDGSSVVLEPGRGREHLCR